MRYLVTARVKPGRREALAEAVETDTLGAGSVAGGEYLRNVWAARRRDDGTIRWVEVCFCPEPLQEERAYWEEYVELVTVNDAHARSRCKDLDGTAPWACVDCDCTVNTEARLASQDSSFLDWLRATDVDQSASGRNRK